MVLVNVFRKLQTVKGFVRPLCEKGRFRTRLDSQHLEVCKIPAKYPSEQFYHVFPSF